MWPIGEPDEAVPVTDHEGRPPQGCLCFNAAEQQLLVDAVPEDQHAALLAEIEQAARDECDALVPGGYDHNCYEAGPDGAVAETVFPGDLGSCVGDCVYTDDCGDPNPYECECIVDGCEPDGTDDGSDETGGETGSGGLDGADAIACNESACEIDLDFAERLRDNPALLLGETARLVYDAARARFVFAFVDEGTVAAELGFRSGDVLESVDGVVIADLDSALEVFAASADARSLRVRVLRGTRWIELEFWFR